MPPGSVEADLARDLMTRLHPLHRSVAGPGLRESVDVIGQYLPLARHDVPTGTRAFDWEVPREWRVRDAWIAHRDGRRLVDYEASNLHIVSHSISVVRQTMSMEALRP